MKALFPLVACLLSLLILAAALVHGLLATISVEQDATWRGTARCEREGLRDEVRLASDIGTGESIQGV